jgi:hypothetical protein
MTLSPVRFSVNAAAFSVGKKCGGDHQVVLNGTTVAFHHRIEALRIGSKGSAGT